MSGIIAKGPGLAELAAEINLAHEAATGCFNNGLEHAIACGRLLIEAKRRTPHGAWLPWLETNCAVNARMAQIYMRLARHEPQLDGSNTKRVAYFSVRQAIAAELGVSGMTVGRARKGTATDVAVDRRIGLDGKARRLPAQRITEADDEEYEEEEGIEDRIFPENYLTAYMLRADQAARFASYSGPVSKDVIDAGRRVISAWTKLVQRMVSRDGELDDGAGA